MTIKTKTDVARTERRSLQAVEMRAVKEGEATKIVGYAAVFNSESQDLGGFIEIIRPGAFARALREKQDIRCLFNHDANKMLGRTASGTLKLEEDTKGLHFECTPPNTQEARDVVALIERGDVNQCSFSFNLDFGGDKNPTNWIWPDSGPARREILEIAEVFDVGPVSFPAYNTTEVSLRSFEKAKAEHSTRKNSAAARLALAERGA